MSMRIKTSQPTPHWCSLELQDRILKRLQHLRMSANQLARAALIPPSNVWRWMRQERGMTDEHFDRLMTVLNLAE